MLSRRPCGYGGYTIAVIQYGAYNVVKTALWVWGFVILLVHSTYAKIFKNRYKKVRKNVGIG